MASYGPCLPRGRNVAIDRSSPLVVKLSDSLPNLVAVSESSSGRTPCSNYDTTHISLAEVCSFKIRSNNLRFFKGAQLH